MRFENEARGMLARDGTTYIARAVSYPPKVFVKSTSGIESIKLFAAVSWSVCLCQSLPPHSNICRHGQEPTLPIS
jgi:hypothetical protein